MKAIFKKIRTFCIVAVLSVSLTVSNAAAVTYQAAAIPVVYSSWQVIVTIFALLGITLCAAEDHAEAQLESADELVDKFEGWRVLKGEGKGDNDGDGLDDYIGSLNPLDYLVGNTLTIPEEELELWQQFYWENMAQKPVFTPSSNNDYSSLSLEEYKNIICQLYNLPTDNSTVNSWISSTYSCFYTSGLDGFIACTPYNESMNSSIDYMLTFVPLYDDYSYSWGITNRAYPSFCSDGSPLQYNIAILCSAYDSSVFINSKAHCHYTDGFEAPFFLVNGQLYNHAAVFFLPIGTSSNSFGNTVRLSDFKKSVNNLGSTFTDVVNTVSSVDLTDIMAAGDFDVVGNGREWDDDKRQAVGDISVPMPAPETITDYSTGAITYEDMMNELEMTPVNEATGTNLLTQEFISTQTGIFSGVNSIVQILQDIWAWLNNLLDSIVQAFIDMLVGLFVPGDGFIDGKIGQIQSKLDLIGVAPYDMSHIFDSDDGNPFRNITIDIYGKEVVIVSFDYLPPFLDKFRPVIRGLLVLLLLYYSINQLLALLRLSGMMEGGNINQLSIQGSTVPKIEDKGGKL